MDLKALLNKYIAGNIKTDDFRSLRDLASNTSDKELDTTLQSLWMESESKPMNLGTKEEVRENLQRQLHITEKKRFLNWKNIAVSILLPALILSTTYLFITSRLESEQKFVVESAKGQKTQIYLPDGTKVWLNSGSYITYNSKYNRGNRSVSLKGEAFFEVEKNENSKFIVDVDGVAITVHGTAFNITAYENDSLISVSLNRGKVSVENTNSLHLIANLLPNQEIVVNRNDLSSELTHCDAELNSLWTQNRLKLEEATPSELFKKMEHWYGVNITIENENHKNKYSLTIKTESLREMLDLINKLTPITYSINGEEVTIRYK
ncbi:MAG: FecR family protein [Dysgonomonas sp.]|nr:FecR family protein [Dysgonomonas sp.]